MANPCTTDKSGSTSGKNYSLPVLSSRNLVSICVGTCTRNIVGHDSRDDWKIDTGVNLDKKEGARRGKLNIGLYIFNFYSPQGQHKKNNNANKNTTSS